MASPIIVNGKIITGQQIAGFKTSATNAAESLGVWANACAIQTYQGNNDWANSLFSLPTMRLASGKLSVQGKGVLAYIKAHAPLFNFDTVAGKAKFNGAKAKKDGRAFTLTGEKVALTNEAGEPSTDFPLSFTEFLNFSKPKVEKPAASLKAGTVQNQVEKALTELAAGNFAATAEEAKALADTLASLLAKVASLHAKKEAQKPAEEQGIDATLAEQLLKSGQAGKSKRAGGKVEKAA